MNSMPAIDEGVPQSESQPAAPLGSSDRGNDAGGFLSHALVYGLGSISLQVVSVILLPLYTWKLPPEDFGVLQLLYRVGDVVNICLMVNGIQLAVLNFWGKAESDDDRKRIAPSVVLFTMCFLLCGGLVVLLVSGHLAEWLKVSDWRLLACGILAIMLQATTAIPMALMQARFESRTYAITALAISASQLLLISIVLIVFDWGIWGVVLAFATNSALFGCFLNVRAMSQSSWRPSIVQLRELVRFAVPFVPSGLCLFVLHNGDQFFLVKHHDAFVLGIYALAYKIGKSVIWFAAQPLTQVWNAWMYDAYKSEDRDAVFGRAVTRIFSAIAFAGTMVIIFKSELFEKLGGEQYGDAAKLLPPLVLANALLILANLFDAAFYVKRRTELKPLIALASTLVMISAYAYLIPNYAAMGAAVATLIGFAFHFALTYYVSQSIFAIRVEVIRLVALVVISTLICGLAEWVGPGHIVLKLGLAASWPCALLACGLVSPFERAYILNRIRQI